MPSEDSRALCQRAIENLNRRQRERRNAVDALGRFDESVAYIGGAIQAAESVLQGLLDQILAVGELGVGCASGNRLDCIDIAIRLSREKAQYEAKIQRLKDRLRYELAKRDGAKVRVNGIQLDIDRAQSIIDQHQCHRF